MLMFIAQKTIELITKLKCPLKIFWFKDSPFKYYEDEKYYKNINFLFYYIVYIYN